MEYLRAIAAKTPAAATVILQANPLFREVVQKELEKIPEDHWERCLCVAAEAYQTGMILSAFNTTFSIGEHLPKRARRREQVKQLKDERRKIVQHCQAVGILPAGLGWLFIRWLVLPFLFEILKKWTIGDDDSDPDVKDDGE